MAAIMVLVGPVMQDAAKAGVRDVAVQKLRDVTIAVAVAAAAGVGLIGCVGAATIPGQTGTSGVTGKAATTSDDGGPNSAGGVRFSQAPPARTQSGSGVAVSGGSH